MQRERTTAASGKAAARDMADTVIVNGRVMTMNPEQPVAEAIAVTDGAIVVVGDAQDVEDRIGAGTSIIDAERHVVCPGFIDIHDHADLDLREPSWRLFRPFLAQGVTTVLSGNCGLSTAETGALLAAVEASRPVINFASLVGHGFVRSACGVLPDQHTPSDDQMRAMKDMVARAMRDGAFGLSSGLEYTPGLSCATEELIEIAGAVASFGGFYATHMRSECDGILAAVEEAIRIGAEAGIRVEISHIKTDGRCNWWKTEPVIAMLEAARAAGIDIGVDQYPYVAYGWNPSILVPGEHVAAGRDALVGAYLKDPVRRAEVKAGIVDRLERYYDADGDVIVVYDWTDGSGRRWIGKTLSQILADRGLSSSADSLAELALEMLPDEPADGTLGCATGMSERDVESYLALPFVAVCTDAFTQPWLAPCHPRSYGTYPRVLGRYVREKRTIPMDLALAKMTALPAAVMGLPDRGQIREGYRADITVFDAATVDDNATPTKAAAPSGIDYVLVNGTLVVDKRAGEAAEDGFVADRIAVTEAPGMVLRGPGHRP